MQQVWTIRRNLRSDPDGQRRWDRAYQRLMSWTAASEPPVPRQPPRPEEVLHEGGRVCSCFDPTPSAGADD